MIDGKLKAALLTGWKYFFWTIAGAVLVALGDLIPTWHLPVWLGPIVGMALKSAATYVTLRRAENQVSRGQI